MMNAPLRVVRTAAEEGLAEAFAAAKANLPGGRSIADARAAAFGLFENLGLPHRRIEEWKYTDLRALMQEAKPLASAPSGAEAERAGREGIVFTGLRRLVFVNGAFVAALSDLAALEPGLSIVPLSRALAETHPLVKARLGVLAVPQSNVALALNTAFMGEGAVIHVGKDAIIERPIHLCVVRTGAASAAFTRSLFVVEEGAKANLIESFEGPHNVDYQTNTALEAWIGDGAQVAIDRLQAEGDAALHLSTLLVEMGAHAAFSAAALTSGAAVSRHQIFASFKGEHSKANIRGANLLKARQHADTTMVVDHAVGHGVSRELFKSVLDGESRGVFQGKIIVRPHAQKTDGKMTSHAVLLSETAEMDNKPELEISADDVQCGHGATSGQLDDDLLFYLRARGIPAKEAEALLIQSFVGEAIEGVANADVREKLIDIVSDWVVARS